MLDVWKCAMCGGIRFPLVDHVCHDHKCEACSCDPYGTGAVCNCILGAPMPSEIIDALNVKREWLRGESQ